jgi:hypothetical protein
MWYISSQLAQQLQNGPHSSSNALQEAAWEALAAVPAIAALLNDSLVGAAHADDCPCCSAIRPDRYSELLCAVLDLLQQAGPLKLTSSKHIAPWASAVDAMLRLLPALLEREGHWPTALAESAITLLWMKGGGSVIGWAMEPGNATSGEHAADLVAAARPLAAAHMRACRLVRWLRGRPDGGTALLAEDQISVFGSGGGIRSVSKALMWHLNLCLLAAQAADATNKQVRLVCKGANACSAGHPCF